MRILFLIVSFVLIQQHGFAQNKIGDSLKQPSYLKFNSKALILPAGLITYGVVGLKNDKLIGFNRDIRSLFNENRKVNNIDDFTVITPLAAVYGLDLIGVEAKNDFWDRTIVLGTASAIVISTVTVAKNNITARRPVGKSKASFPSGHTAIAFMSAEFMHQELKDQSIWYSIGGYTVATFTGFMRLYNDKHFFSEVVTGAGIGILGTKIAYWLQPTIQNTIFKQRNKERKVPQQVFVTPSYNGSDLVIAASWTF